MEIEKIKNMNDYLFERLEVITNEDLTSDELKKELDITKVVCKVSSAISINFRILQEDERIKNEYGNK